MRTDKLINSINKTHKRRKRKEIIKQYKLLVKQVKMASNAIDTHIYLLSSYDFSTKHIALRLFLLKNKGFKVVGDITNPIVRTRLEWGKTNKINY